MSDDLSPVEQARAARWAADVADEAGDHGTAKFFRRRADRPAPPETVESLREALLGEHDAWERTENALHEMTAKRDELHAKNATLRRYWLGAREELDEANATITRLRATHTEAEAAWGRCQPKLFPTSWQGANTPQPEGVDKVRDTEGREWERVGDVWRCKEMRKSWRHLIQEQGTVTEVLP